MVRSWNLVLRHSVPPLLTEFWRYCVLNGGNLRRALPRDQREENRNIYLPAE